MDNFPCRVEHDLERYLADQDRLYEQMDVINQNLNRAVLELVERDAAQKGLMVDAIIELVAAEDSRLLELILSEVHRGTALGDDLVAEFMSCADEELVYREALEIAGVDCD